MWFYCLWGVGVSSHIAPWVEVNDSSTAADESWCLITRWLVSAQKLDWLLSERKPFHGRKRGLTTDLLTQRGQLRTFWCFSVTRSDSKLSAPLTPPHFKRLKACAFLTTFRSDAALSCFPGGGPRWPQITPTGKKINGQTDDNGSDQ